MKKIKNAKKETQFSKFSFTQLEQRAKNIFSKFDAHIWIKIEKLLQGARRAI